MAGEPSVANGASGGDARAAILAELAGESKAEAPVEQTESDSDIADETVADEEADAEVAETVDDDATDSDEESTESDDEVEPDEPAAAKGLDQVRRAEKHARAKLDADRSALEQEREQHKAALAEVEQFKALAKQIRRDPTAVLRALGLTDDDFEPIGQAIYADSKAGQADPNRKMTAAARLAQRERDEEMQALKKRADDLEAKYEADKRAMAEQAEVQQYVAGVNQSIKSTPLVAHLHKADPDAVLDGLSAAHARLLKAGNAAPTPRQVVLAYEKRERARLTALGIDLTKYVAPAKAAAKPGAKPVVAADKKPANGNAKPTAASRDDIVAELKKLS